MNFFTDYKKPECLIKVFGGFMKMFFIFLIVFSSVSFANEGLQNLTCVLKSQTATSSSDNGIYKELGRDTKILNIDQTKIVLSGGDKSEATFQVTIFPKGIPVKNESGEIVSVIFADLRINDYLNNRSSATSIFGVDPSNPAFKILSNVSGGKLGDEGNILLNCTLENSGK